MVQVQTYLKVADNSGAKEASVHPRLGGYRYGWHHNRRHHTAVPHAAMPGDGR